MTAKPSRAKWLTIALCLLPLWLIISAFFAVRHRVKSDATEDQRNRKQFSHAITASELRDDLNKLTTWIGERHQAAEGPAKNLTRTAAWIEGLLGPTNAGYLITKKQGPIEWPILTAKLAGKDPKKPAVWLVTTYDSAAGTQGIEANATGLIATLATARALAGSEPTAEIRFVFLPHFNHPDSPKIEIAALLKNLISESTPPMALLCIEAMGTHPKLLVNSRDATLLAKLPLHDLATREEPDPACLEEDKDLASLLFEIGLPAARIATRPPLANDESDTQIPSESTLAESAANLTELTRRCANSH